MTVAKCLPHRGAPRVDGPIALGAGWGGHDVACGHVPALARQRERRPVVAPPGEQHVHPLDLPSRKPPFQVQVQTDEREGQRDGPGALVGVLGGPGVDDVLVKELAPAVGEGVGLQLLVGVLFGHVVVRRVGLARPRLARARSASRDAARRGQGQLPGFARGHGSVRVKTAPESGARGLLWNRLPH